MSWLRAAWVPSIGHGCNTPILRMIGNALYYNKICLILVAKAKKWFTYLPKQSAIMLIKLTNLVKYYWGMHTVE